MKATPFAEAVERFKLSCWAHGWYWERRARKAEATLGRMMPVLTPEQRASVLEARRMSKRDPFLMTDAESHLVAAYRALTVRGRAAVVEMVKWAGAAEPDGQERQTMGGAR